MNKVALKNIVKRAVYAVRSPTVTHDGTITLGYVFHTERVQDDDVFARLLEFCRWYRGQTDTRVLCTAMSAVNPLIRGLLERRGMETNEYAERLQELSEVAVLGYHGHFWRPGTDFDSLFTPEHGYTHSIPADEHLARQLHADLDWFAEAQVEHNGIYAAGWWYLNPRLMELLIERGFETDVSHSYSHWHQTAYTRDLLGAHKLPAGQPFRYESPEGSMVCVQYLTGCHTTPFPECFYRAVNRLGAAHGTATHALGFVGAHDFDLDHENTTKMIEVLVDHPTFRFSDPLVMREDARKDAHVAIVISPESQV